MGLMFDNYETNPYQPDYNQWGRCSICYCNPCVCNKHNPNPTGYGFIKSYSEPVDYEKIRIIIRQELVQFLLIEGKGMKAFDEYEEALKKANLYDSLVERLTEAGWSPILVLKENDEESD